MDAVKYGITPPRPSLLNEEFVETYCIGWVTVLAGQATIIL